MPDLTDVLLRKKKLPVNVKEFKYNPAMYDFHKDGRLALDHSPQQAPKRTRAQLLDEAEAERVSPEMRSRMAASDWVRGPEVVGIDEDPTLRLREQFRREDEVNLRESQVGGYLTAGGQSSYDTVNLTNPYKESFSPKPVITPQPGEPIKPSPSLLNRVVMRRESLASRVKDKLGTNVIEIQDKLGIKNPIRRAMRDRGKVVDAGEREPFSVRTGEEEYVARGRIEEKQIKRNKAGPEDIHIII